MPRASLLLYPSVPCSALPPSVFVVPRWTSGDQPCRDLRFTLRDFPINHHHHPSIARLRPVRIIAREGEGKSDRKGNDDDDGGHGEIQIE
jgi:hypothetical protein